MREWPGQPAGPPGPSHHFILPEQQHHVHGFLPGHKHHLVMLAWGFKVSETYHKTGRSIFSLVHFLEVFLFKFHTWQGFAIPPLCSSVLSLQSHCIYSASGIHCCHLIYIVFLNTFGFFPYFSVNTPFLPNRPPYPPGIGI